MKLIILAAGYATRLWPLTKDKPKPLLEIKGKPIVEYILDKIQKIDLIDEIFVVTNDKFFEHFLEWNKNYVSTTKITVINDGTKSNEDRLGALGDIKFVVDKFNIEEDIMVILGDNLFEFSYEGIMSVYNEKKKSVIVLYDVKDINLAKQPIVTGEISVKEAYFLSVIFLCLSLVFAWLISILFFILTIIIDLIGYIYSMPPLRLKTKPGSEKE